MRQSNWIYHYNKQWEEFENSRWCFAGLLRAIRLDPADRASLGLSPGLILWATRRA